MNEVQKNQFFANRSGTPHTVKVNGKFVFASLPTNIKKDIRNRLAEKDPVIAKGLAGELPGLKIDGRQVTRENLHEFEKSSMSEKPKVKVETPKLEEIVEPKEDKKLYTKSDLDKLSFKEVKEVGKEFGTTDRSKRKLIQEILKIQGGK